MTRLPCTGVDLLGCIMGSNEFQEHFLQTKVDKAFSLPENLPDIEDSQYEFNLLNNCVGVNKVNFLLLTIEPGVVNGVLDKFDSAFWQSLEHITGHCLSANHWTLVRFARKLGGNGIGCAMVSQLPDFILVRI